MRNATDGNHRPVAERDGEQRYRAFRAAAPASIDEEAGTVEYMITTPDVDAFGDVVVPEGMDNARFRKNPVVQWNHDYWEPPIGISLWEEVSEAGVKALAKFALAESEFAAGIFRLVKGGILSAVSIGFWPTKSEPRWGEEGEDGRKPLLGYSYPEWMLLEYSPVPIPANENALALAVKGIVRVAHDLGMDSETGGRSQISRILRAEALTARYPELVEKDGLEGLVARTIEDVLARRHGLPESQDAQQGRALLKEEALDSLHQLAKSLRA